MENRFLETIHPIIFLEFSVPTSKVVCLKKELLPLHIPNIKIEESQLIYYPDCTAKQKSTMVEACRNSYLLNTSFNA